MEDSEGTLARGRVYRNILSNCNIGVPLGAPKLGPKIGAPGKEGPKFGAQFWNQILSHIWVPNLGLKFGPSLETNFLGPNILGPDLGSQTDSNLGPGPRSPRGKGIWGARPWTPNWAQFGNPSPQIWGPTKIGPQTWPKIGIQI